jgi:hypothetical protein
MPAKNLSRINEDGIYLHIYNKGIENRAIFNDKEDYEVFLEYLKEYLSSPKDPKTIKKAFKVKGRTFQGTPHLPKNYFNQVELIAYNLTSNHFHLILHQISKGSLEKFLRSLSTRYSIYFNKKYQHTGALFAGPYRSVQIEVGLRLSHLTRYLHLSGNHTSYPDYLGQRQTPWLKPEAVLDLFGKEQGSYQDFVERDLPDQNLLLEKTTLEPKTTHLERSLPKIVQEKGSTITTRSSLPEFLTISIAVFLLLFTLGIGNIKLTEVKISQNRTTPVVLSETIISSPIPTPPQTISMVSEKIPQTISKMVTVKADDGSSSINIRQRPILSSPKIGSAKAGDRFELINRHSDWFEIKLASGSGFISTKYMEEEN